MRLTAAVWIPIALSTGCGGMMQVARESGAVQLHCELEHTFAKRVGEAGTPEHYLASGCGRSVYLWCGPGAGNLECRRARPAPVTNDPSEELARLVQEGNSLLEKKAVEEEQKRKVAARRRFFGSSAISINAQTQQLQQEQGRRVLEQQRQMYRRDFATQEAQTRQQQQQSQILNQSLSH